MLGVARGSGARNHANGSGPKGPTTRQDLQSNVEQLLGGELGTLLDELEAQLRPVAHQPLDGFLGGLALVVNDLG